MVIIQLREKGALLNHKLASNIPCKLSLRMVFPNEANDFTPWLASNNIVPIILSKLEEKEFKLWKREVKLGDYRMDMIYQSNDKSKSYIVENQYGLSDNKHFGQIVMYRYLSKISNVLWICDEVSNEHKNIIKEIKDINCIPCSVEIYKINDTTGAMYKILFKIHSKEHNSKIFVFICNLNLEDVVLKEII